MTIQVDKKKAHSLYILARSIKHPLRISLLKMIGDKPGITVTEMWIKSREEHQSTISQNLKILRDASLVEGLKDGKEVRYHLILDNYTRALSIIDYAFSNCH